ncbi:MAG: gamma carbonic anhydrase family protein [Gammaproteobacteria bacterium]|nr:gamma carbonic anhydrase family protein [Gammaproteobacteria bacterium]MXZ28030.1 gamma carbonic anhydrase family protein [Gammaproteobacteria bacterium]MYF57961.1 gamma carbonic anhydrase family protein [Gammaproteobacteria bacterium]MYH33352.1 gamma carbonic anhydrase family protein [Gammaproteobacteria bacterium]MYL00550.1 gamma carbonic anhydrase family protein [Gammaproteobacteria bacterium]
MIYDLGDRKPRSKALFVAPDAAVIGSVELGEDSSVWYGAVLRGDTEPIRIGARSNIQDGTVVHTDDDFPTTIGDDVTVGHNVILHGCTIEDGCTIGMGAILLNGSRVGANSLVAAGALLPEGREYPSDSLIMGVPARAVRELTDDERARVAEGSGVYLLRAREHRDQLQARIVGEEHLP